MSKSNVKAFKQAVNASKKIFIWAPIAHMQDGTIIGGYVETYRPQIGKILSTFALPQHAWDVTVSCFFRVDPDTQFLYIDGFNVPK